jgi:hypothetical protein
MLLRSGTLQDSSPGLALGSVGSLNRGVFGTFQVGEVPKYTSVPSGYDLSKALYGAITAQQMASRVSFAVNQSLSMVGGRALVADPVTITFDITGDGDAVASATGTVTITFGATGAVTSPGPLAANVTLTITPSATIGAQAGIFGETGFSVTGDLNLDAWGLMVGTTVDNTTITNDSVAAAVWSALAAAYNEAGSMGEKLNGAGTAGDPWTAVIEAGYTAKEILRLLAAHAAGDGANLEGGNPTFKGVGVGNTTTRITATYSAGTRTITSLDTGA